MSRAVLDLDLLAELAENCSHLPRPVDLVPPPVVP